MKKMDDPSNYSLSINFKASSRIDQNASILAAFENLCESSTVGHHQIMKAPNLVLGRLGENLNSTKDLDLSSQCSSVSSSMSCKTVRPGVSLHQVLQTLKHQGNITGTSLLGEDFTGYSSCGSISTISEEDHTDTGLADLSSDVLGSDSGVEKVSCSKAQSLLSPKQQINTVSDITPRKEGLDQVDTPLTTKKSKPTRTSFVTLAEKVKEAGTIDLQHGKKRSLSETVADTQGPQQTERRVSTRSFSKLKKIDNKAERKQFSDKSSDDLSPPRKIKGENSDGKLSSNKKKLTGKSTVKRPNGGKFLSTKKESNNKRNETSGKVSAMQGDQVKETSQKVQKTNKHLFGSEKETIVLSDWIIKPVTSCKGVCVEGKRSNDDFWHSTAIVDIIQPKLVVTASGSRYQLEGRINKHCTLDAGFTKEVARAFYKGFPSNWKTLIADFYNMLEDSISGDMELHPFVKKKWSLWKRKGMNMNKSEHPLGNISIVTAKGVMKRENATGDVTMTRSGRRSMPPLARWAGQHYVLDPATNTVKVQFQTEAAEQVHTKQTKDILNLKKLKLTNDLKAVLFHKSISSSPLLTPRSQSSKASETKHGQKEPLECELFPCADKDKNSGGNKMIEICVPSDDDNSDSPTKKKTNQETTKKRGRPKKEKRETIGDTQKSSSGKCKSDEIQSASSGNDSICEQQTSSRPGQKIANKTRGHPPVRTRSRSPVKGSHNHTSSLKADKSRSRSKSQENISEISAVDTQKDNSRRRSISPTKPSSSKDQHLSKKVTNKKSKESPSKNKSPFKNSPEVTVRKRGRPRKSSYVKVHCTSKESESESIKKKEKSIIENKKDHDRNKQLSPTEKRLTRNCTKRIASKKNIYKDDEIESPEKKQKFARKKKDSSTVGGVSEKGKGQKRNHSSLDKSGSDEEDHAKRQKLEVEKKDTAWTKKETTLFNRALREVNNADSDYWAKISEMVRSRTEQECQEFHKQTLEAKSNKPAKKSMGKQKTSKKNARQKGEPLRGGQGTLKRKQDLREFLDEQNEGYSDNLFGGTPFVNRKPVAIACDIDFDKDDSEVFGANHNFFTPSTNKSTMSTPGTRMRATMASAMKTPAVATVSAETPVSVNRYAADRYIRDFIKRKKASHGNLHHQSMAEEEEDAGLPVKSFFSPILNPAIMMEKSVLPDENDEEDEESQQYTYYWDDV